MINSATMAWLLRSKTIRKSRTLAHFSVQRSGRDRWSADNKACESIFDAMIVIQSCSKSKRNQVSAQRTFVLLKEQCSGKTAALPVYEVAREQLCDTLKRQKDVHRLACIFVVVSFVWLRLLFAPSLRRPCWGLP